MKIITKNITELDLIAKYKNESDIAITFPLTMASDANKKMKSILKEISLFHFQPYDDQKRDLALRISSVDFQIGMKSHSEMLTRVEEKLKRSNSS